MNILRQKYRLIALWVLPPFLLSAETHGESLDSKIQKGISNYEKQQYENASQLFQDAHARQPNNHRLAYNLANSNYKSRKFDKALDAYAKAMADDTELRQKSLYNSGNALYRLGKLEEAAATYKKALELNPADMDAKYNLEFVREQIKKQQRKHDQQDPKSDNQQKDAEQQKNSDQTKRAPDVTDKKEPDKNHQGTGQEPQKQSGDKNPQSAQLKPDKSEMTKDEADQWLRSLVENPRKFAQKQIQDQLKQTNEPVGNDW